MAILNRHATRQALAKGPITRQSLYSVLPFDNQLVVVRVRGDVLVKNLTCCAGHFSGVKKKPDGTLALDDGGRIDDRKTYKVLVTDYIYFGGSGFTFEKADPNPDFDGDWRNPLITWFKEHPTTPQRGLEASLDRKARP